MEMQKFSREYSPKIMFGLILMALLTAECRGYDPEASITGLYTGPYFDPLANRNLTAHLGDRAVLPCTVRQLGDKSVSWIRLRDADILTVDRYTFVSDERFKAYYTKPHETWNLVIMYVQERDAGIYECQVSTEPKMSQLFNLRVVVPRVSMVPPGDRFVKTGSKVRIDCHITDVVQQPDYIFWYHKGTRVLDSLDPNLKIRVKETGPESMVSTLTISKVQKQQSGNYTCMPSNLHSSSVNLHVLIEEHQAAMQDGRNSSSNSKAPMENVMLTILFVLCVQLYVSSTMTLKESKLEHVVNRRVTVNSITSLTGECLLANPTPTRDSLKGFLQMYPSHENLYRSAHRFSMSVCTC